MLNSETKRRIDTARDILVGKVPDPKTQVEQITFAMIYKFMDDMDQISVQLGGKPSFFTNGYEQFAWSKLLDRKMSGESRLDLYVRSLEQMSQNPHIPQLFRDIFKGAFLPYRDSETLNLFLKEINGFSYTHSEDLGDAYEYLLLIFATQGKAGQFRTPRHIIDFIIDCVNPDLNDTVLDPACGTAGFLISAYQHILDKHTENPLSPDQKQILTENFVGYDIFPDMVRLSRVNMYLHQFSNPTIHEYDTLTTEDRWDDTFDVILANPPFMTPKGGIRPHKRFAVRANRSEVLFVDYITEHLNVGGRAGVIVPEGIIFQSSNAYKALRKMLVEEGYLYAVVSLPAGIFQPYSGVKTSILLMDKTLAKQTNSILFVKIEADGFDLGAQRGEIKENDLPEALEIIKDFQTGQQIKSVNSKMTLLVKKRKLAEGEDYNLSAERYKNNQNKNAKWRLVELTDLCLDILSGGTPSTKEESYWIGNIPWITSADIVDLFNVNPRRFITQNAIENSATNLIPKGNIIVVTRVGLGKLCMNKYDLCISQDSQGLIVDTEKVLPRYLLYLLSSEVKNFTFVSRGSTIQGVTKKQLSTLKIPIPPLTVQQQIVDEIDGYQKVIDGARQVVENYKPVIHINPDWPLVKLGNEKLFKIESGGTPSSEVPDYWDGDIPWITLVDLPQSNFVTKIVNTKRKITRKGLEHSSAKLLPKGSVIISSRATIGRIAINEIEIATNQGFKNVIINDKDKVNEKYLALVCTTLVEKMTQLGTGGTYKEISKTTISSLELPLPNLETQKAIVGEVEEELRVIDANKTLIERFEAKIVDCIRQVWEL